MNPSYAECDAKGSAAFFRRTGRNLSRPARKSTCSYGMASRKKPSDATGNSGQKLINACHVPAEYIPPSILGYRQTFWSPKRDPVQARCYGRYFGRKRA